MYWIVMARNTLQMVEGYSPHQLVFGRNPEIPIMTGDVSPSMTEELPDTSLREILEYAHKAREIYVQQEADRKLKRTLSPFSNGRCEKTVGLIKDIKSQHD